MFGALCRDDAYPSTFTFNIGKAGDDLQHPSCCMAKDLGESIGPGVHGESYHRTMGQKGNDVSIRVISFEQLDIHLV